MNALTKNEEIETAELIETNRFSGDLAYIYNDDFSRLALSRIQHEIDEDSTCLNQFSTNEFSGWSRDCADEEVDALQHQVDQFFGLLDNAKPFEDVLFDSSRIYDLESADVVRKVTVEPDILDATICDFDCGTGSRTLSIMRYLYEWNGTHSLSDKDFVIVGGDDISLRLTLIQILFHLHKWNLRVAKLSAYVSDDTENWTIVGSEFQMIVYGTHNFQVDFGLMNEDHDCVVAETKHLLVLAP